MNWPKVTFGLLSWNRLHYLRATLESAFSCIEYPDMEWIVSDNESEEPGLKDYLQHREGIHKLIVRKQTHADAMNELVSLAQGKYLFIWPEDVQFVVKGDWLKDVIEVLESHPDIGSVGLDAVRRKTMNGYFKASWRDRLAWARRDLRCFGKLRRQRKTISSRGFAMHSLGGAAPGVCGSGIPTLTRTEIWKELGGWRTRKDGQTRLIDSSLGAEDNMVETFYRSGKPLQMAMLYQPVAADIITDPTGCKAKVRGLYRFGDYMPAPDGVFYYRIRSLSELNAPARVLPLSFFDVAEPIGFQVPKDKNGDRLKSSLNTSIVYHIAENRRIDHPLADAKVCERL
ncbi:MAG: hypothetical protein A2X46_16565 [Lentisphaerae bacterium GWF2_57_35]|nr:MAG: hypothetical protein A2X46_16565 [Lentisphaerae bacterium GWF2_57_35]